MKNSNKLFLVFTVVLLFLTMTSCKDDGNVKPNELPTDLILFVGDLTLSSQAEVDSFNSLGYDSISGILNITGSSITNLDGMSNLTSVGSRMHIVDNDALVSLEGLTNLESVAKLHIKRNSALLSLEGLENLSNVVDMWINENSVLLDLGALNSITSGFYFEIVNNAKLINIGLDNLSDLDGLLIQQNNALVDLDALSKLVTIETWLGIKQNTSLENLCGLQNISLGAEALIAIQENAYNPSLEDIKGGSCSKPSNLIIFEGDLTLSSQVEVDNFNSLGYGSISGVLTITGSSITNLDGMSNLTSVGTRMHIVDNDALVSLEGLSNLSSVAKLHIKRNSALLSLEGLENLSNVVDMWINENPVLLDLGALSSITSGFYFEIVNNAKLINIGLDNLSDLDGLLIQQNNALTDLDALNKLVTIETWLGIKQNTSLENLCGLQNISLGAEALIAIQENAYNPSLEDIKGGSCSKPSNLIIFEGDLTLSSQVEVDNFNSLGYGSISGVLTITGSSITNLDGMSNLTSVGTRMHIVDNDALVSLEGLSNLSSVAKLHIKRNNALVSLKGLENLSNVDDMWINENPVLLDLGALSSITSGFYFEIVNNAKLENIGLQNLIDIDGLLIQQNNALTDLDALNKLVTVETWLGIKQNTSLENLCGIQNIVLGEQTVIDIQNNAFNPSLEDIKGGSCSSGN